MTEVRRSPTPRFSDEAYAEVAARLSSVIRGRVLLTAVEANIAAGAVLSAPSVEAEFDAACLSAYRSGRESAGRGLAERLRERAATTTRLCRDNGEHDDRYCSMCSNIADGYDLAADLIEQWAKAEEDA